ncbi:MAG: hydroxymethylglutaryl-CoA lyase [Candidatus Dadabacteria bacterium]|nr:MAG: hydroxymethylglutaryl-CoA lyase [Candidatus Dadabacteria bacterium]
MAPIGLIRGIPDRITLTECFARDGIQSIDRVLTTDEKLAILRRIIAAGFDRIEATSFVPEKIIPQFFDAETVLERLREETDAELIAFVPNAKGMQRAAVAAQYGAGPDAALIVVSASEAHNRKNLRRSTQETIQEHRRAAEIAQRSGIRIIGSISTSFGCPYTGDVPVERVLDLVRHYRLIGATEIQFGDTTGMANPFQVRHFFSRVLPELDGLMPVAHFHDTRGAAIANSLAALDMGVRIVDTSLGGLGGRPPEQRIQVSGPTGNTSSEDFAALVDEMGIETGLDIDLLIEAGRALVDLLADPLHSHIVHAGRVRHSPEATSVAAG